MSPPTSEEKKELVETPRKEEQENSKEDKVVNPEDIIDTDTFDQLLDMDDEEDHEFSYSIVVNYFEQAEATFKSMDTAL